MKSKTQIRIFLKTVNPCSEKDKSLIEGFGLRHGFKVNFGNELATRDISFDDFLSWVNEKVPGKGDPIAFTEDGSLGVLLFAYPDSLMMGATLKDGILVPYQHTIPYSPYRYASEADKIRLQRVFSRAGLSWSKKNSQLVSRMVPTHNSMVKISRINEKLGMGIYRETDSSGQIIMYCLKMADEPIRFSLYEKLGPQEEYQFELLNNNEREEMKQALSASGRIWNGRASRIEPLNFQAENGCRYFYLNEYLAIVATYDYRKKKDISRYMSGNYFREYEEAERTKNWLVWQRKQQLLSSVVETDSVRRKRKTNS